MSEQEDAVPPACPACQHPMGHHYFGNAARLTCAYAMPAQCPCDLAEALRVQQAGNEELRRQQAFLEPQGLFPEEGGESTMERLCRLSKTALDASEGMWQRFGTPTLLPPRTVTFKSALPGADEAPIGVVAAQIVLWRQLDKQEGVREVHTMDGGFILVKETMEEIRMLVEGTR